MRTIKMLIAHMLKELVQGEESGGERGTAKPTEGKEREKIVTLPS